MTLQDIQSSMIDMETGQRGFSITGDESFLEPFNKGKSNFDESWAYVKELTSDNPNQQELLNKIKMDEMRVLISKSHSIESNLLDKRAKEAENLENTTNLVITFGTAIALMLSLSISTLIIMSIVNPINQTSAMIKDIAEGDGDLTKRLKVVSNDEIGIMAKQFNLFVEHLHNIIKNIKENSNASEYNSNNIASFMTA